MNPYEIIKEVILKSDNSFSVKGYIILVLSMWFVFTLLIGA